MFVELWAESKATPRLFERRIKDNIKEIETFITTDCLTVMFFRLVFAFFLVPQQHVLLILLNKFSDLK
jgi:hypothetical protein